VVGNIGWISPPEEQSGTTTTPRCRRRRRRARGPLRQNPPRPLRRVHSLPESAHFAHKLTGRVSEFTRGDERKVFRLHVQWRSHRYGVFICYESVFADEVRQFAQLGAEVLVNISDDGWYGDTSAPWQHLNMARMRAIENRRWICATPTTASLRIDPYGRVRQSIPRHQIDALPASSLPRRHHLLHRPRRRVCVAVCHTWIRDCCLGVGRKLLRQRIASS
jgi:hypothetical protein